jgi:septal ring factor EnvC (AmiA/AmiB activator)
LILDAGDGYHMVLAGIEEATVGPGDRVTTGAPLGRMGAASRPSALAAAGARGSALLGSRPALYVELRRDGAAIDGGDWWRDAPVDVGRTVE